jgi:hypothetical protein
MFRAQWMSSLSDFGSFSWSLMNCMALALSFTFVDFAWRGILPPDTPGNAPPSAPWHDVQRLYRYRRTSRPACFCAPIYIWQAAVCTA